MDKWRMIKIFFFFTLAFGYALYAFSDGFIKFFMATATFNAAITLMFIMGVIVLGSSIFKVFMLEKALEDVEKDIDNIKPSSFSALNYVMPQTVIEMFNEQIGKKRPAFSDDNKEEFIGTVEEALGKNKGYIDFVVGNALMLGLMGTFMGLLVAIEEMGAIVTMIAEMEEMDIRAVIKAFAGPLGGMAVGFGSSLFGVAVAITLNLLYYMLSKGEVRYMTKQIVFFNKYSQPELIEEKISQQINIETNQEELLKGIHNLLQVVASNTNKDNK